MESFDLTSVDPIIIHVLTLITDKERVKFSKNNYAEYAYFFMYKLGLLQKLNHKSYKRNVKIDRKDCSKKIKRSYFSSLHQAKCYFCSTQNS